jgi:hypothetical protein
VLIFENGYGAINPRLVDHQEGAQATKSAHPFAIRLLQRVYDNVGFRVRIGLPHLSHTKAELVARIPRDLRPYIRMTVSCDGFPLRLQNAKQCGYCGSCILRQQALRCAGLQGFDRDDYLEFPFETGRRSKQLLLMAFQARQFIDSFPSGSVADIGRRWPEIALGDEGQLSFDRAGEVDMLRRYGLEWQSLVTADAAFAARIGWTVAS